MSYATHGFKNGQKLFAGQLNEMDAQIESNDRAIEAMGEQIDRQELELERKADAQAVEAALEAKADMKAVNAAMEEKADAESVNDALAGKADADEVNAALEKKADANEVNKALEEKASKKELEDAIQDVNSAVSYQKAQALDQVQQEQARANIGASSKEELYRVKSDLADDMKRIDWKTGVKKYIVRWDKVTAQCTRMGDAAGITTDITHFAHRGSVDADYANPFDELYPWSHRKLCKVDRDAYKAIFEAGGDIMGAVTMWEDEPGFALGSAVPGMDMVYTPTFWRTCWEDESYVYAAVADGEVPGWEKRPATIGARYHASADADGNLTSQAGDIAKRFTAFSTLHSNAKAQKMTLDDIFTWCDDTILMVVEFATMNTQNAVGQGVCSLYREDETGHPLLDASGSNTVILPTAYKSYCIPGAVLDIGTSKSGGNVASRMVESVEDYSDTAYCVVTFSGDPVDILTTHYCAIHGMSNTADAEIGSKSGYIGTNGRCIAYYRGRIAHGNYWRYVLGAYRQTGTGHIYVAGSRADANAADALDTSKHTDTGCALPQGTDGASTEVYLGALHILTEHPLAPFGAATGGNSSNPIGDYLWVPELTTGNTILMAGARANGGAVVGRFSGGWWNSAGNSLWSYAVLLFLISPEGD
ncbi:MAG: coiled-coil domain-containing protein [Candidatus Ventricola sp.]